MAFFHAKVDRNLENPSLTISLAMVAGVLAQSLAVHMRLPGIVVLLFVGVILGPDVADLVRPQSLNFISDTGQNIPGLQIFVGFAVAIILFEGGLQMNFNRLRKQVKPIHRLVTIGALVTAVGGTLAAKLAMGWPWGLCILFGTLVIVTGPTVITPLLRRFNIQHDTATILEAEGIFIDAVGATVAVVTLQVYLKATAADAVVGVFDVLWRIGIGAAIGAVGGAALAFLLHRRNIIPEGLENILALAIAIATFQISNSIVHESGITAAIIAGMVMSNTRSHAFVEIAEFKEQLTVFAISTLFVLLVADVRIADVMSIAGPGLIAVALLMFVVRPLSVLASTYNTDLTWQQKAFLSWLAPRGIVAAAVASLFAVELVGHVEGDGAVQMRALVFLVIATTVTVQGLTGGILAKLLDLKSPTNNGYVILGANPLARSIGRILKKLGDPVILMDSNEECCTVAKSEGFTVVFGNGLERRSMAKVLPLTRRACIALTPNETVNFLYAQRMREHFGGANIVVALETEASGVTDKMVENLPAHVLFGAERPLGQWVHWIATNQVTSESWELNSTKGDIDFSAAPIAGILPLGFAHKGTANVVDRPVQRLQKLDKLHVLIRTEERTAAYEWLRVQGFVPVQLSDSDGESPAQVLPPLVTNPPHTM